MRKNIEEFDYEKAFSRNLGWLSPEEQVLVSEAHIAIPGMGGVGGHHFHALLRMGFQKFSISDLDHFEIGNFNRQFGASMSAIGLDKTEVLRKIAHDINPNAEIRIFSKGINLENMEEFLEDADIVCGGLDLYASDLRTPLYNLAHKKGLHVLTAGPFGLGTSIMCFHPDKMSFGEYFDLERENLSMEAKIVRFLVGMSPYLLHRKYLAAPDYVRVFEGRLPSLHGGVYAASAAMASNVLKIVLKRGKVHYAPYGIQTDFYLNKQKKFWRPFGNRNPIQRFLIKKALKMFEAREFI